MRKIFFKKITAATIFVVMLAVGTSVAAQFSSFDTNTEVENKEEILKIEEGSQNIDKETSKFNVDTNEGMEKTSEDIDDTAINDADVKQSSEFSEELEVKADEGLLDAQTKELYLIKILQEGDTEAIKKAKEELIRNAISRKNAETINEEELEKDVDGDEGEDLNEILDDEDQTQETQESTAEEVLEKKEKLIERAKTEKARREASKDLDEDGVSDYDEMHIYNTDPNVADSDGDGYIDGAEILSGFNPLNSSIDAIIKYENPKETGAEETILFAVGNIEVAETKIVGNKEVASKILFEGVSLPNSFVTLYIFSIPTVITIKTDEEGNWNYTLDKELEDGEHEIFVAMTDNSGKILAKSSPIPFIKQAAAITVDADLLSFQLEGEQPSFFAGGYLYLLVLAIVFVLGIVLIFMGIRLRRRDVRVNDTIDIN